MPWKALIAGFVVSLLSNLAKLPLLVLPLPAVVGKLAFKFDISDTGSGSAKGAFKPPFSDFLFLLEH